jgi:hypothetical protein
MRKETPYFEVYAKRLRFVISVTKSMVSSYLQRKSAKTLTWIHRLITKQKPDQRNINTTIQYNYV